MRLSVGRAVALLSVATQLAPCMAQIQLNTGSEESYRQAAKTAADGLKAFYSGDTPGNFDDTTTYPWWIVGGMFMELIEYWNLTGDDSWNSKVREGLLSQMGPDQDFRPDEQFYTEANDDQLYWGMAAMTAAEYNLDPPDDNQPSWLALAQAVFNRIVAEWNTPNMPQCGGGFRWQYNKQTTNSVTYKNTPTNGGFFELASRLATYTGNQTYADWAEKTYNWMSKVKIIQPKSIYIEVNDGVNNPKCGEADEVTEGVWSYNYGAMVAGSAYLYKFYDTKGNTKEASAWKQRTSGLVKATHKWLFQNEPEWGGGKIMAEWSCELKGKCDVDQMTFKGYTSRWLTLASFMVPMEGSVNDDIMNWLMTSSVGAAKQCSGGGNVCGIHWFEDTYDGSTGPGQQMSAMSLFANNIVRFDKDPKKAKFVPLTTDTGGQSEGDPSAGTGPETVSGTPSGLDEDTIWNKIKTPVIATICGLVAIGAAVAGYFIWRKWFRTPKAPAYKDFTEESQQFRPNDMNASSYNINDQRTPTLPNVQFQHR